MFNFSHFFGRCSLSFAAAGRGLIAVALIGQSGMVWANAPQQAGQASRPKIGLVLGGGGARGSAHVGVLKVLEEMRIPVDYIAGNSMGAIVGGLYASGMSPDQIGRELQTIDWDDTFNDDPPRSERSFRRKQDDNNYLVKPRVGVSDGEIKTPLAYIHGQKFDLQLSRLTLRAVNIHDFDKLPIPFRAVASDIETGKAVVLQSGSLARAIRASMAVPGAFDPVEIDGKLLVDGLVANNVPVDVARAMGAEVLIVVDVGSGLYKREQIKGALDVVAQLTNILSERNVELQLATLKSSDILIRPQLGDLGSGDFDRAAEGIASGEQAARVQLSTLQHLSLDQAAYTNHKKSVAGHGAPAQVPVIDFVRLDNRSRIGDAAILSHLTLVPGQPLDNAQLDADIGRIYGLDVFESVRYEVVEEGGKSGVVLHAKEKSWGPNYLQFGFELAQDTDGDNTYNIGVLYTRTAINSLNGELRLGLQIGQSPSAALEWYQPIDSASRYFVNTGVAVTNNLYTLNDGDGLTTDYTLWRAGTDLAVGRELGTWGEARIGYRWAYGNAEVETGSPVFDDYDFRLGQVYVRLSMDVLDNVYFPRDGDKGRLELSSAQEALGSDSSYEQAYVTYVHAFTWGRHTLVGLAGFSTTFGDDAPLESLFHSGGFLHLSGYRTDQLSGQHAGQLALAFYRRISDLKILPAYVGGSLEYGNVWQERSDIALDDGLFNGSIFLGADTPIGPLYVGVGFAEAGRSNAFIYLGPVF